MNSMKYRLHGRRWLSSLWKVAEPSRSKEFIDHLRAFARGDQAAGRNAARILASCRASKLPWLLDVKAQDVSDLDISHGYQFQKLVTEELAQLGWKSIGFKIGATGPAVQKRLNVKEPFFGELFNQITFVQGGNQVSLPVINTRGIEAEWGFILKRELPILKESDENYSMEQVAEAVGHCVPCIEVTGSRFSDVPGTPLTFADGAGNGLVAIGGQESWRSVSDAVCKNADRLKVTTWVDGEKVAEGDGSEVYGHPLKSLTWFANNRVRRTLRPGDLVISGAANGMYPLPSDRFAQKPVQVKVVFDSWAELSLTLAVNPANQKTYSLFNQS